MDTRPIGIFDSGCGGLTVLRAVRALLPQENLVYFGDTKHVPYGDRNRGDIFELSFSSLQFLSSLQVKLILIACHTVSSTVFEDLQMAISTPLIGMVEPTLSHIQKTQSLVILGTTATISSGLYQEKLLQKFPRARIQAKACPSFVPLIEKEYLQHPLAEVMVHQELLSLTKTDVDTVLLACTHYPLLAPLIQQSFSSSTHLIDPATSCAIQAKHHLEQQDQLAKQQEAQVSFFVSGDLPSFSTVGQRFLPFPLCSIQSFR
ncbi:MAG: glutamate racemase [Chlamydiae bacterium]|nr:glutamate racemase [Chlamydiota bacterium]